MNCDCVPTLDVLCGAMEHGSRTTLSHSVKVMKQNMLHGSSSYSSATLSRSLYFRIVLVPSDCPHDRFSPAFVVFVFDSFRFRLIF